MSLKSALDRIDRLANKISKEIKDSPDEIATWRDAAEEDTDRAICEELTPVVQRMLVQNLRASSVKKRSGGLEAAVAGAKVWLRRKRGRVDLFIGFKPKIKSKGKTSVYVYGSALNYGAVHQPMTTRKIQSSSPTTHARYGKAGAFGRRAKRSLKKAVLGEISRRAVLALERKKVRVSGKRTNFDPFNARNKGDRVHISGGVTVIKPRNFFHLTPVQTRVIQALYDKRSQAMRAERQQQQAA